MSSGPPRPRRVRERPSTEVRVRRPEPARVPRALASAAARDSHRPASRSMGPLGPARAAGLLGMLVAVVLGFAVTTGPLFVLDRIDTGPLRWTDRGDVLTRLDVAAGEGLFTIDAAAAAARLVDLPAVLRAEVAIALPDTLVVRLTEREPILAWVVDSTTFLVDREGRLFALAPGSPAPGMSPGPSSGPSPDASAGPAALPVVVDRRASAALLRIGSSLSALDLEVATRLASVTATDIGSRAEALSFGVDDTDGYTMVAGPDLWTAVFGTYVPGLRAPDLIPGQVRLLRSLLFGREASVARVFLADDRNGTYVEKAAP